MEKEDTETKRDTAVAETANSRKSYVEMSATKDYSDLEVVVTTGPAPWDCNEKMAVHEEKQLPPVPWDTNEKMSMDEFRPHGAIMSPTRTDPVPAYYPNTTRDISPDSEASSIRNAKIQESLARKRQEEHKICGMSNKVAICVALGLIIFILALLATVLGVYVTIRSSHSSSSSGSANNGILGDSKVAAVNWTDPWSQAERTAVFFQDDSNAIMMSLRDMLSNEWVLDNVTAHVLNSTRLESLDILPGTPFAAVTNSYQVSLYYLTSNNNVGEIWSNDLSGGLWYAGALTTTLTPTAMNNSQISAFWQICNNCTNSLFLVYQDTDGALALANLTNGNWADSGTISTQSTDGTGVAISAFADFNGTGNYSTNDNALRVFHFDTAGALLELDHGPATNFTWEAGNSGDALSSGVTTTDPSPTVASMTYGDHGWTNNMVTYLASNGTLVSHVYTGSNWTVGAPTLTGGPDGSTNLSCVATTQDMKAYGLSNGSIYEYLVNTADPFLWVFQSVVAQS